MNKLFYIFTALTLINSFSQLLRLVFKVDLDTSYIFGLLVTIVVFQIKIAGDQDA